MWLKVVDRVDVNKAGTNEGQWLLKRLIPSIAEDLGLYTERIVKVPCA